MVPDAAARTHIDDLGDFITASPSSYHAAAEVLRRVTDAGFTELSENEAWAVRSGGSYVVRRDGAVIAFRVPERATALTAFSIVGTHTDSPGFRLKPTPDAPAAGGWSQLQTEIYGGPILASWLDRDLRVAGRLILRDGTDRLVSTPALARIPHLAIHLDRSANEGLTLDRQRHTQPVWAFGDGGSIIDVVASAAGLAADDVAGFDLFLADTQPPAVFGKDDALFASGRLDNLLSTHAALCALLSDASGETVRMLAAFDHEEVGSATRSGAGGPFLEQVLDRIRAAFEATADDRARSDAASFHVSSDVGHALHPNYSDRHDPVTQPRLGEGPILKVNASQRYATDGRGEALWRGACERADVPFQAFVSNNAIPCGSTIGPITAERLGIPTVDVGAAILSMHSARELTAVVDPWYLSRAMREFLGRKAMH